jgi:hypothetical protein
MKGIRKRVKRVPGKRKRVMTGEEMEGEPGPLPGVGKMDDWLADAAERLKKNRQHEMN